MDAVRQELKDEIARSIELHQATCPIKGLVPQVASNAAGVGNFRKFQLDAIGKLNFVHGAVWAWSIILAIVLGVVGYTIREIMPLVKAITVDYYERHPNARVKPRHSGADQPGEVYAAGRSHPDHAMNE